MNLLPATLAKKLPPLYSTEDVALEDKMAVVKFFHPASSWTWYAIEYDGQDLFFGLVCGHETEFGYFSLKELAGIGKDGTTLPVERDLHFDPTKISKIRSEQAM